MKKFIFLTIWFLLSSADSQAGVGIFNPNIYLNNTSYSAGGNLGAFNPGGLILNGGWGNTWQDGSDDACHIVLEYVVSGGGPSGSIIINYVSQNPNSNGGIDKYHQTTGLTIDLSTLSAGNYTLTVDYKIYGRHSGTTCGTPGNNNEFTTASLANQVYQFSVNAPLSVRFSNINVTRQSDQDLIQWSTLSESNNDYFVVQASLDGRNFDDIDVVKGSGNSNSIKDYSLIHFLRNNYSDLHYRIKQVDFDGQYEYSPTVMSKGIAKSNSFSIYPNPAKDYILIDSENSERLDLIIEDLSGKVVQSGSITANEIFDVSILPSGVYVVSVLNDSEVFRYKLIKK